MLNIETGFGFAVELFVVFFSFFCWLVTPVAIKTEEQKPIENRKKVSCFDEEMKAQVNTNKVEDLKDLAGTTEEKPITAIKKLTVAQLQKTLSKLKENKLISDSYIVRGKRKPALLNLVLLAVIANKKAVLEVLTELGIDIEETA